MPGPAGGRSGIGSTTIDPTGREAAVEGLNGSARPARRAAARHPRAGAPAPLEVNLLGRVELAVGGREVRLASRGAQALLAVLVLKPRIRTREAVAAEIWPDGEGSGTTASLRQALWLIRSSFVAAGVALDPYVDIDAEIIGLRPCAPVQLDVLRFEASSRGGTADPEAAVRLYRGDLVECLDLECFAFDRERLSDAYEDALALVAEHRLLGGDLDGARDAADELLSRDPLREEAHVTLLRVYGRTGSRPQVLRQYRRLATLLDRELGVEPLPETMTAFRSALAGTIERSRQRAAGMAFGGRSLSTPSGAQPGALIPGIAQP
jgi:DNA-binding SARP family transcriptional activator